ncbi:GTPase EngB [Salpingoeca rosetta]|uniref:GTP-binding protein 8 n=1 Tax=Salpingoeca rosetta (strain ATCC 50818 / BSB-021) TaxID=946362 RepID=F2TZ00_SALR5|nr:GTPase EngB [Salpingoeca rosetta]EGD78824.1 GTPase EngB [Salpingoeca rosetta]|eukprot:XP_004997780.1 GTPase EngB [Salpingoeca rosetta]
MPRGGGGGGGRVGRLPTALAFRVLQLADPYASLGIAPAVLQKVSSLWSETLPFKFLTSAPKLNAVPPLAVDQAEVVLMGASNVGKSTLLNALLGTKLAYTSKTPGHTKMLNFFQGQRHLRVVDVPGYGFGSHQHQMTLLGDYFHNRQGHACACLLIDAKKGIKDLDLAAFSLLLEHFIPYRVLLTKADRLPVGPLRERILECEQTLTLSAQEFNPATSPVLVQPVSAKQRKGLDQVRASICEMSGLLPP